MDFWYWNQSLWILKDNLSFGGLKTYGCLTAEGVGGQLAPENPVLFKYQLTVSILGYEWAHKASR